MIPKIIQVSGIYTLLRFSPVCTSILHKFSSPFKGCEFANRSTSRTCLRVIPHDVQGAEEKREQLPSVFLQRKDNNRNKKTLFAGEGTDSLFTYFSVLAYYA